MLSAAPARPSLISFLEILTSASEQEAPESGQADSGAATDAEAPLAGRAASPPEDIRWLSAPEDEIVRGAGVLPAVDQQTPSEAWKVAGEESSPQISNGILGAVNQEPRLTTDNGTSVPIHSAASVVSSYAKPSAQNSAFGNTFQKTLVRASWRETSEEASMNPGANTIAGAGATSRPASRYESTSTVSVGGRGSDGSKTTSAPVDRQELSTEQKSSVPENGRLTKVDSFGLEKEEGAPATASLQSLLASSTAESSATNASPLKRTSPSVNTVTQTPAGASEQEFSRNSVRSDGEKTPYESSPFTPVTSQRQAATVPSITGKEGGAATATRSVDQESPDQTRANTPGRSQFPTGIAAALPNRVAGRVLLDDPRVSVASQASVMSLPAKSLEGSAANAGNSTRTTAGDSMLEILAGSSIDSGEKSPVKKFNSLSSLPVKFASSPAQTPVETRPPVYTSQRTLVSNAEGNVSGIQFVQFGSQTHADEMRVAAITPAGVSGFSSKVPTQAGKHGNKPQQLIPDASEKHVSGNVLIRTTGKTHVNQTDSSVSPTAARSISSGPAPAQVIQFSEYLEPMQVSAPDGQVFENGLISSDAQKPTEMPSEIDSTREKAAGSIPQGGVETRPTVNAAPEITRSTSDNEAPERTIPNTIADPQACETTAPASSPATAPISFERPSVTTHPISDAIAPVHFGAQAPEGNLLRTSLVNDGTQKFTEALIEGASTPAKAAGPIPQSRVQSRPPVNTTQEEKQSTSDNAAPKTILPNTIAIPQTSETTAPAPSHATVPISFAQPFVTTQRISDAIAPVHVSVQAPEAEVFGSNSVGDVTQGISTKLSASTPDPAPISAAPSQSPAPNVLSTTTVQPMASDTPKQDASRNWPAEKRVDADAITGSSNQLPQAQSPSVAESVGARIAEAALPVDDGKATPDIALSAREKSTGTKDGPPAAPAQMVSIPTVPSAREATPKQIVSQSVPDIATPQQPKTQQSAMPPKPLSQAAPRIASVDGKPAAAANSNARSSDQPDVAASPAEEVIMLPIDLPMTVDPASSEIGNPPAGNAVERLASSASVPRSSQPGNATDAATGKTTDATSASGDTLQHGAQNSPQSSQSRQADLSHAADSAPKVADSAASQTQVQPQTVPLQAPAADIATAHRVPDVPEVATRSAEQQGVPPSVHSEGGEVVASSSVNTARLMQTMSESEMHVGMRSSEFGDISIRTSITDQQMVTRISLDHSELSQAISAHVSSMQTKLGEDSGLNASIEVHNLGSSHSGEPGQSSQREQRNLHQSSQNGSALFPPEEEPAINMAALANAGSGNRLDIRA